MPLTEKERTFLDAFLCENQHVMRGPATKKLWAMNLSYHAIVGMVMAYCEEGPKPNLIFNEPDLNDTSEVPWESKEAALARSDELEKEVWEKRRQKELKKVNQEIQDADTKAQTESNY
jgi:hypothetical protein